MAITGISKLNLKGKTVLVRADLNSDIVNGKVIEGDRIKESAETIKLLKKKKAKVVVIAHQGRPGKEDFLNLRQHGKLLNKYVKIKYLNDVLGKRVEKEIKKLMNGEALLLENIRREKSEFSPEEGKKNKIIKFFLPLIDIYVNDAFSVCHRKQTSIIGFPKFLPSFAGPILEREVKALDNLNIKNCLYILGGAKPEDNSKLLGRGKKVLAGGIFGQMCVLAKGIKLGKNNDKENKKFVKNYEKIINKLRNKLKNVLVPEDFAIEVKERRVELGIEDFPTQYIIYDIGKKTQAKYIKEIKKAKAVYMKGPLGYCGKKNFCQGTFKILKTIAESKGFSVIGGGHLSDAMEKSKTNKKRFNHISLSGGALLRYIAGEKLPGIEALK